MSEIRTLEGVWAAVFACGCAERTTRLWERSKDRTTATLVRQVLDLSWQALAAVDHHIESSPLIPVDLMLARLGEDCDFGTDQSALFDSVVCVSHAANAVFRASSGESTTTDALLAAEIELRFIKAIYYQRYGTYSRATHHESFSRQQSWQDADIADLLGRQRFDAELVEKHRVRAHRQSTLVLSGAVDDQWGSTLPDDEWPTLFD